MTRPQPSLAQLRPALKLAFDTAASAGPGRALPGRVRNLVRSRRLPASWAVTMLQAIDEDDAFRSWVAGEASEESLGRVAWLWLTRPEGWADELSGLIEEVAAAEEMDKEVRLATERADALERELASVREELERARAAQSSATAAAEEQRRAAAQLEVERRAELSAARTEREARVAEMERVQGELEQERDALGARVEELEGRLAGSERARLDVEADASGLRSQLEALATERDALRDETERRRASVADAVERAAVAASELGAALAAAASALNRGVGAAEPSTDQSDASGDGPSPPGPRRPGSGEAARPPVRGRRPRRPGGPAPARRPVDLPLGIFEDSSEAAAFLVRVPGVHLVVDGYNVALTSWGPRADAITGAQARAGRPPATDLPSLRRRLLDALGELAVRVQRAVTVVFDGQDEGGRMAVSGPARPWLRVVFSASSVEADELILDAVGRLRPEVPVVVATNDREVRDSARDLGANVISVDQILAVLNRRTSTRQA